MGAGGLLLALVVDCLAGVLVSARGGGAEVGLVRLLGEEVAVAGGGGAVWVVDVRREDDGGQNRENNDFRSAMKVEKQEFKERREGDYVL